VKIAGRGRRGFRVRAKTGLGRKVEASDNTNFEEKFV